MYLISQQIRYLRVVRNDFISCILEKSILEYKNNISGQDAVQSYFWFIEIAFP